MQRSWKVFVVAVFAFILSCFALPSLLAQSTSGASGTPGVSLPGSQSPFQGSAPEEKITPDVLQIDFKEAIDRGLRNNLGVASGR